MDIELAAALVPYLSAAIGTYGPSVGERVRATEPDRAVDSTTELGRALLGRILDGPQPPAGVGAAVAGLATNPADEELTAELRRQLREALAADPELARVVSAMLSEAGVAVSTPGEQSVAVRTVSEVTTGEWPIIQPR
ncbi:hypothetical protein AB0J86_18485 [Micromonospora sp. NPDC049559]|uniref:hypothetical protein n=1 Tax=Micromonospora sp. NPDC049559 TaxID=3155923 RepID=UPI00343C0200